MLGAAHALANPLTAMFDVPHGEAVALMLSHVIRHNGQHVGDSYGELVRSSGPLDGLAPDHVKPNALADWIARLARQAGLAGTLTERGVPADSIPQLAAAASQQWTAKFNPVEITVTDCQRIYESAL
jgi:alcohol dehydrogenase